MHDGLDLILYVDDDDQVSKYFRLLFARDYQVLTASSAKEALNILEREDHRVTMIVSDQRMPERTGVELLEEVKERYPRIIRLITTAYSDMSTAIAAVNRGSIYAYISKPWNTEELKLIIRRAFEHRRQQRELGLLRVEKDGFCQSLLAFDRLRSIGMLAAISARWVHRPFAAASAYWRDSNAHFLPMSPLHESMVDLSVELLEATGRLARSGLRLCEWLDSHHAPHDEQQIDAGELAASITVMSPRAYHGIADGAVRAKIARPFLIAGISSLTDWLTGLAGGSGQPAKAMVDVHASTTALTVTMSISGAGYANQEAPVDDLGGLQGYLAVCHHAGSVEIDHWGAKGGVLKIVIPCMCDVKASERDDGMRYFMATLQELSA